MDAHDREYAGAVAGMAETYGSVEQSCSLPSVGDRIAWRTKSMSDTSSEAGRVIRVGTSPDNGLPELVVEPECGSGLRVIDPRPWPAGNLLPF